jgi:hypothetical protein
MQRVKRLQRKPVQEEVCKAIWATTQMDLLSFSGVKKK